MVYKSCVKTRHYLYIYTFNQFLHDGKEPLRNYLKVATASLAVSAVLMSGAVACGKKPAEQLADISCVDEYSQLQLDQLYAQYPPDVFGDMASQLPDEPDDVCVVSGDTATIHDDDDGYQHWALYQVVSRNGTTLLGSDTLTDIPADDLLSAMILSNLIFVDRDGNVTEAFTREGAVWKRLAKPKAGHAVVKYVNQKGKHEGYKDHRKKHKSSYATAPKKSGKTNALNAIKRVVAPKPRAGGTTAPSLPATTTAQTPATTTTRSAPTTTTSSTRSTVRTTQPQNNNTRRTTPRR